jgi:hypothetical protein
MDNLARKLELGSVMQEVGTVVRVVPRDGAPELVVRTHGGEFRATRATSCLLEPEAEDLVLLALVTGGGAYVLAVLEREAGAAASIAVDGDLRVKLKKGRFGVAAQEGIDLVAGKDVSVVSGSVGVNAREGSVVLQQLSLLGQVVRAEVESLKLLAGSVDSVLDRVVQKVKRSYRVVEERDQVQAETIDYTAKKTMSLHAENALVTAEELVKVDGEQIHVG